MRNGYEGLTISLVMLGTALVLIAIVKTLL